MASSERQALKLIPPGDVNSKKELLLLALTFDLLTGKNFISSESDLLLLMLLLLLPSLSLTVLGFLSHFTNELEFRLFCRQNYALVKPLFFQLSHISFIAFLVFLFPTLASNCNLYKTGGF